jgi:predicted aconitase
MLPSDDALTAAGAALATLAFALAVAYHVLAATPEDAKS